MDKENIKKKIEQYELFRNGLNAISGSAVRAVNMRLSGGIAICDIKLIGEEGVERHHDCRYDLKALGWI